MDFCALLRLPKVVPKDRAILRNLSSDCDIDYKRAKTCTFKNLRLHEVFLKEGIPICKIRHTPSLKQVWGFLPEDPDDVESWKLTRETSFNICDRILTYRMFLSCPQDFLRQLHRPDSTFPYRP